MKMNPLTRNAFASLVLTLLSAQTFASSNEIQISNRHSGKVLDEDVSIEGKLQQWKNYHSQNQKWVFRYHDDGTIEILNAQTGRCLDIQAANILDPKENGHYAHTWECTGALNQRFKLEYMYLTNPGGISGTDGVRIRAIHSNKCLDVADWSRKNGATIQQWDCHDGMNQRWDLLQ